MSHNHLATIPVTRPAWRFVAAMLICLLLLSVYVGDAMAGDGDKTARPYWLLVTFAVNGAVPADMAVLKGSPFDGIAMQFGTAYDTGPAPSADSVVAKLTPIKDATHRDVWPWVFVNRVAGLDVSPNSQARDAFLDDWRAALRAARVLGAPGVVLDLEFYSDPSVAYAISRFAQKRGISAPDAGRYLESLGHQLGYIVAHNYPNAKILVLTSGLANAADERIGNQTFFQPRGQIVIGLLKEVSEQRTPAVVIDGGEDDLGYCHANLADLRANVQTREQKERELLRTYSPHLILAGTIAPWADSASKKGWLTEGACGAAQANRAEDFAPYLRLLDGAFQFNWIYAAPAGGYQPFNAAVAARFDTVIRTARGEPAGRSDAQ